MNALSSPTGPYPVGSCSHEVRDSSRASHVLSQDRGRELFAKLWYPADVSASDDCERERLWEQLRADPNIPGIARLSLRPAMKVVTNSRRSAPYSADANDASLTVTGGAGASTKTIPGTKHLNFHDIAAIYPLLKWLKITGSARPMAVVEQRNRLISDFVSEST